MEPSEAASETVVHYKFYRGEILHQQPRSRLHSFPVATPTGPPVNCSAKISEPLSAKQTMPAWIRIRRKQERVSPSGLPDPPPLNPPVCLNT
ncbi:hypothetical protein APTSU1_001682100 [Apodemus speciosus]|uniref:Uncharacterized protein n=1 Tax=Apodemus speciosus TaxID=105296 RepID=A0ABQ0FQQ8_APOSI